MTRLRCLHLIPFWWLFLNPTASKMRSFATSLAITLFAIVASATPLSVGSLKLRSDSPTRVVDAAPAFERIRRVPDTNKARFARGLPPLPPKRRAIGARQAQPSTCPSNGQKQGRWHVRSLATGVSLGYVSQGPIGTAGNGGLGVFPEDSTGPFGPIPLAYPMFRTYGCHNFIEPFTYTPGSPPAYLAGAVPPSSPSATLDPSDIGFTFVGNTEAQTPHGSTPQTITSSVGTTLGETAIWSFDPVTNAITAQWVNPDGSTSPTSIMVANVYGDPTLVLTGNVGFIQTLYSSGTQEVTITFESV